MWGRLSRSRGCRHAAKKALCLWGYAPLVSGVLAVSSTEKPARSAARVCSERVGERVVEIRFPSQPDRLRTMRAAVSDAAAASGCGEACIRDIVIAVDEACQNVIRHAYKGQPGHDVVVDMRYIPDYLVIYVIDFGPPANIDKIKPRPLDELRPGGLGTHFIKECMDETEFRALPDGAGNMLEMVKRIY